MIRPIVLAVGPVLAGIIRGLAVAALLALAYLAIRGYL